MTAMSAWSQAPVFVQSVLIGLSIGAPVGPIGLLTIQRTLAPGPRAGLATGLGAALANAVYGAVGASPLVMVAGIGSQTTSGIWRPPLAAHYLSL